METATITALKDKLLKNAIILTLDKNNNQPSLAAKSLGLSLKDFNYLVDLYDIEINQKEDSDFINFDVIVSKYLNLSTKSI